MVSLVWVVGDIHGCFSALKALEDKIELECERRGRSAFIVSVGDLIDRGPDSRSVVQHFIDGARAHTHAVVMGNHEMMLLRCLWDERPELLDGVTLPAYVEPFEVAVKARPRFPEMGTTEDWLIFNRLMWLSQGGAETIESYGCDPKDLASWSFTEDHLRFIASLPIYWEDENAVVTHALATSKDLDSLRSDTPEVEASMSALWTRRLPSEAPDPERVHVSGHSIRGRVGRCGRRKLVRIDLGAYCEGRLAAFCPELNKTVSVSTDVRWRRGH